MYCEQRIRNELAQFENQVRFIIKEETGSTNDDLSTLAKNGEKEFLVMIAESQTRGKGRMGRTFHSPKGSGIYMSILLCPAFSAEDCNLLTPMTAVAAAKAIEKVLGIKSDIKWVNDIYLDGRKAAGILTKAAFSEKGSVEYAVVGIGINLALPKGGFHEDIKDIAGSLKKETSAEERDKLVGAFLREFLIYYKALPHTDFFEEYKKRLLWLGKKIAVKEKDNIYEATALDIDERFRLKICTEKGEEKLLYTEEISIRGI